MPDTPAKRHHEMEGKIRICSVSPREKTVIFTGSQLIAVVPWRDICYLRTIFLRSCHTKCLVLQSIPLLQITRVNTLIHSNLPNNEAFLLCDFSENHTLLVQDAVQSFDWDAPQCTIHPFVLYWKDGNELKHKIFLRTSTN